MVLPFRNAQSQEYKTFGFDIDNSNKKKISLSSSNCQWHGDFF